MTERSAQRQLTNEEIAELLARQADKTSPPAQRALRRASRRAFLGTGSIETVSLTAVSNRTPRSRALHRSVHTRLDRRSSKNP
jgi:hypothetical protein